MRVKESRHRPKRANLCGKRWSIFAKGNMARVPLSKLSPLDCPKHDEPELSFRRRNEGRPGRRNRQRAIHEKLGRGVSRRRHGPARCEKRCSSNRAGLHRTWRYRVRHVRLHGDARKLVVQAPPEKLRARASETVKPTSYFALITRTTSFALPRSRTGRPWFEYRRDQKYPALFSDAPTSVSQNRSSRTSN